jgi:hypothetical protein
MNKYTVTISFEWSEEFAALVPAHRRYINFLINKGIIDHYAVTLESQRAWITLNAANKEEVVTKMEKSPLFPYFTYMEIDELIVLDGLNYRMPVFQLN